MKQAGVNQGGVDINSHVDAVKQFLKTSQLFEDLRDAELGKMAGLCREEVYDSGTVIFNYGSIAERLYIVKYGKVTLEATLRIGKSSGRQGTTEVITKGQVFGCSAICETKITTTTARCIEKTGVLAFNGKELSRFFEENPCVGYKVMLRLSDIWRSRFQHIGNMLAHILSITSHDLKAPLAAVESYHQVILDGYAGEVTEKQKNILERSSERINSLLHLLDNILDISQIESRELKVETLSLLDVAEKSLDSIRPLAEKKQIKLNVHLPKKLTKISGSAARLEQVFTNLLGNAVKFTDEGGTITLKVNEEDDRIVTAVMDTGIGISAEELPRIFDDFFRGIRVTAEGAGLGLAISKKIIEAHKGKIWVESPCPESGVGSKFTFTLPKDMVAAQGEKKEV